MGIYLVLFFSSPSLSSLSLLFFLLLVYIFNPQMSNRDVIAQEVMCYEAVFKVSKLLDQLCEGLQNLGILEAIRTFPGIFLHLLMYTASASKEDVLDAIYVDDEDGDRKFSFLKKFIEESPEQSKIINMTIIPPFLFFPLLLSLVKIECLVP